MDKGVSEAGGKTDPGKQAGDIDRLLWAVLIAILAYGALRAIGFAFGWRPP